MSIESHGHEHEFEPQHGLPERLPADERILWQGSPDFGAMARRVFHIRKVAFYFAFLLVAHAANLLWSGSNAWQTLMSLRWLLPMSVLGIGAVAMLAWMTAKTTVYTLTDKRIVMRVGIVLTVTFNLPLKSLTSAGLLRYEKNATDGCGDITLALGSQDRIAWLQLWPSVRPWRFTKPEPMLRAIANAQAVSDQLSAAWSAAKGQAIQPAQADGGTPANAQDTSGNSQPHRAKWQAQTT
jgi:Bacterial PH domain